jgi:hypothetical protein
MSRFARLLTTLAPLVFAGAQPLVAITARAQEAVPGGPKFY